MGYLALVSFTDASFFPISPAIMLIPMILAIPHRAFLYALVASGASTLGGIAGYALGFWAFQPLVTPVLNYFGYAETYQQALGFFDKWGTWAVFFAGLTPIPYKLFTIGAGVMELKLMPFLLASFGGRASRFFLMGALLRFGGPKIEGWFRSYLNKATS